MEGTSGCTQICTDSYGSFKCTCYNGYQLQNDGKTCDGKTVDGGKGVARGGPGVPVSLLH